MKLGIFIPSEKKYIIKKLCPDYDDESNSVNLTAARNEYREYVGLTKDARTTNYQICKLNNSFNKSLFHSPAPSCSFFTDLLSASGFLAPVPFEI
jgi:hypothetical protein